MSERGPESAVEFHLLCPVCTGRAFERTTNHFYRFEEEVCEGCNRALCIEVNGSAEPFAKMKERVDPPID